MVISPKKAAQANSLGLYIEVKESAIGQFFFTSSDDGPYRRYLTVHLNRASSTPLEQQLVQAITSTFGGYSRWPVRLDWENVKPFFSVIALRTIEAQLRSSTVYLYGAAELDRPSINSAKVYAATRYKMRKDLRKNTTE